MHNHPAKWGLDKWSMVMYHALIFMIMCATHREKNFEEFSKHLKGLVNLYKLPGDK